MACYKLFVNNNLVNKNVSISYHKKPNWKETVPNNHIRETGGVNTWKKGAKYLYYIDENALE